MLLNSLVLYLAKFPYIHKGYDKKKTQPFLRLGIARYFWCMSLFANQFPQSQSATGENRNHFPPSGVSWIYERRRAIYSSAWQKEKWVCISTQLYTFDRVENVKSLDCEYSFQGHTESNVFICLADHWVDINSLVLSSLVHLVLRQSPPSLFKVLSSFRAGIVRGRWKCLYLTQITGMSFLTASILETIPWPRNGNKPLAETSDKERTISHCMCVNMHLCVFVHWVCVCLCAWVRAFVWESLFMQAYIQVPICVHLLVCDVVPHILSG